MTLRAHGHRVVKVELWVDLDDVDEDAAAEAECGPEEYVRRAVRDELEEALPGLIGVGAVKVVEEGYAGLPKWLEERR